MSVRYSFSKSCTTQSEGVKPVVNYRGQEGRSKTIVKLRLRTIRSEPLERKAVSPSTAGDERLSKSTVATKKVTMHILFLLLTETL